MIKMILFPALTTSFSRIFIWIAQFIADADAIEANGANKSLAKGPSIFTNGPANLPNESLINSPD